MQGNRGVVYIKPGLVEVHGIDFPNFALGARQCHHGVILKVLSTDICGSDQHMVRARTTAPVGLVLGHEITGEVLETGRDVEFIHVGDIVSVPFNIVCGRCRNCTIGQTGICLNTNQSRPGAASSHVTTRKTRKPVKKYKSRCAAVGLVGPLAYGWVQPTRFARKVSALAYG